MRTVSFPVQAALRKNQKTINFNTLPSLLSSAANLMHFQIHLLIFNAVLSKVLPSAILYEKFKLLVYRNSMIPPTQPASTTASVLTLFQRCLWLLVC